jgi:hypothetical protein
VSTPNPAGTHAPLETQWQERGTQVVGCSIGRSAPWGEVTERRPGDLLIRTRQLTPQASGEPHARQHATDCAVSRVRVRRSKYGYRRDVASKIQTRHRKPTTPAAPRAAAAMTLPVGLAGTSGVLAAQPVFALTPQSCSLPIAQESLLRYGDSGSAVRHVQYRTARSVTPARPDRQRDDLEQQRGLWPRRIFSKQVALPSGSSQRRLSGTRDGASRHLL